MSILYSPERSAPLSAPPLYELEDGWPNKVDFLAAVQAQNRQHQVQCSMDRRRKSPAGFVNKSTSVVLFCPNLECTMRICAKTPKSPWPGMP
jgi:hypothetical protein